MSSQISPMDFKIGYIFIIILLKYNSKGDMLTGVKIFIKERLICEAYAGI